MAQTQTADIDLIEQGLEAVRTGGKTTLSQHRALMRAVDGHNDYRNHRPVLLTLGAGCILVGVISLFDPNAREMGLAAIATGLGIYGTDNVVAKRGKVVRHAAQRRNLQQRTPV